MNGNARKIRMALEIGPIRAIGNIVYNSEMRALMNTTDLHAAIQELGREGISVQRTDAGGSPTWDIADGLKEDAAKIVEALIENDERRSCGMCEREFGVHDPNASHGNCKRHVIASYQQLAQFNPAKAPEVEAKIREIEGRPDSAFPPDLARPENEQLRNSLQGSDFTTNDRQTKTYLDQFHRLRGEQPV